MVPHVLAPAQPYVDLVHTTPSRAARSLVAVTGLVRAHAPFCVILGLAALLRAVVTAAYSPAFEYLQDSFSYLADARHLNPDPVRPVAYSFFLRALSSVTDDLRVVPVVQHLLALTAAALLYALLRRLGVGRWGAALGLAPLLLDSYQLAVEQFVLSETLFEFLTAAAFTALLWHRRPGWSAGAGAGALLSVATVTRTVGVVLLAPAAVVLLVRLLRAPRDRHAWLPLAAFAAACAVVLGGYVGWFRAVHGRGALVAYNGYYLAGRMMSFGDCGPLRLTPEERALCDTRPVSERGSPGLYTWDPGSPLRHPGAPSGPVRDRAALHIATQIVVHQPVDYARTVVHDLLHYFSPLRRSGAMDGPVETLQFPTSLLDHPWIAVVEPPDPYLIDWNYPGPVVEAGRLPARYGFALEELRPTISQPLARFLRDYQRVGVTPGPLLALGAVLGLAGGVRRRQRRGRLWLPAATLAAAGLLSLVLPALTAGFDFRYSLPTLVLLPPAGVLGAVTLLAARGRPLGGARRTAPAALGALPPGMSAAAVAAPPGVPDAVSPALLAVPAVPTAEQPALAPPVGAARRRPPAVPSAADGAAHAEARHARVHRRPRGRERWLPRLDIALILVGLLLLLLIPQVAEHPRWLPGSALWHDGWERYQIVDALVHGTPLRQLKDVDPGWTGRWPLLPTLLAAPLWYLGDLVLSPAWWLAAFNLLAFVAGLSTLWWCLRDHVRHDVLRTFLLLLVAASMFPGHLVTFMPLEVLPAMLLGVGLLAAAHGRRALGWSLAAVGAAVVPAAVVALGLVAAVQVVRERRARYLLAPAAAVVLIVADNYVRLGTLQNGYAGSDRGAATILPFSSSSGFHYPLWLGALGLLLSPGKGLVFFAPGLFLPVRRAGAALSAISRRAHVGLLLVVLGLVVVYSAWWGWDGGFFWGPRFLLLASVPACLALAAALHRPPRSLGLRAGLLVVLLLSVWVGVNGAVFGMTGLSRCDPAVGTGEAYLCVQTTSFSPLFHPLVHLPPLRAPQILFLLFGLGVFVRLAAPLVVGIVRDVRARTPQLSPRSLALGWRL